MPSHDDNTTADEMNKYLAETIKYQKASLALQLHAATGNSDEIKPEILLATAGFTHKEISLLLGKKQDAVKKAISRAKIQRTSGN